MNAKLRDFSNAAVSASQAKVVHTRLPRALTMPSRVIDGVGFTYFPHYQWLLTEPILEAFFNLCF